MLYLSMFKVLGLRLRGQMGGEGLQAFHYQKLFYLSLHTIDREGVWPYANTRMMREISDAWLDRKISHAGLSYDNSCAGLSEQVA